MRIVKRGAGTLRRRVAIVLGVVAGLPAIALAAPASASLTGPGWSPVAVPAGYTVDETASGISVSPVSCVAGTQFCVVIAVDVASMSNVGHQFEGDLVTTDGGKTWNGYSGLPEQVYPVSAVSCPTTLVCWAVGNHGGPQVAESTDGARTWTLMTPASWTGAGATWSPNAIDCVTATTCWAAGMTADDTFNPALVATTDGGATWTRFTNLPAVPLQSTTGTYILNGISCISALQCVAVGGFPFSNGTATVIATTDGGATWSLSPDPTLRGVQELLSVSCLPATGGVPVCNAAGSSLQAAGPVEVRSADGGTTWSGMETYDNTGWMSSVSCADTLHCWAAAAGTTVALVGTATGGTSWAADTSDTSNEVGSVSCAVASFCVATTDNGVWVTNGVLGSAPATRALAAVSSSSRSAGSATPVSLTLPKVSASNVWVRSGSTPAITGQYRGSAAASKATVVITPPSGNTTRSTAQIRLNHYYSTVLSKVMTGTTTVTFTAGNAKKVVVKVHGHPGPAPAITALSSHAGPEGGGNTLTVTGVNFAKVTKVLFGSVAGTRLKVASATRLTVRVPAGTRARFVTVITASGGPSALTGRAVYNYLPAPVLTGLAPASGPAAGGTTVIISGRGFAYVKAVHFGSRLGTHLVVMSARQIKVVAPAGSGTVNVRVSTAGGTSAIAASGTYSYT